MNHKFDESCICVTCGHSQGWTEKWQVFECVPEVPGWNVEALMLGIDEELALPREEFEERYVAPAIKQAVTEAKQRLDSCHDNWCDFPKCLGPCNCHLADKNY